MTGCACVCCRGVAARLSVAGPTCVPKNIPTPSELKLSSGLACTGARCIALQNRKCGKQAAAHQIVVIKLKTSFLVPLICLNCIGLCVAAVVVPNWVEQKCCKLQTSTSSLLLLIILIIISFETPGAGLQTPSSASACQWAHNYSTVCAASKCKIEATSNVSRWTQRKF